MENFSSNVFKHKMLDIQLLLWLFVMASGLVVAAIIVRCTRPSDEVVIEVRCNSVEALNDSKTANGDRINSWFTKSE